MAAPPLSHPLSLPVWERGLKFFDYVRIRFPTIVAPRVGAWIEIGMPLFLLTSLVVAPREGAWIEIGRQGRNREQQSVAPREGAWIEMPLILDAHSCRPSLPVWERGLKFCHGFVGAGI